MSDDKMTLITEEFEKDKTGERVEGITVIVDGKLKEVMDLLLSKSDNYTNYTEIVKDAIFKGINELIRENK
jgi:hypothetical protein